MNSKVLTQFLKSNNFDGFYDFWNTLDETIILDIKSIQIILYLSANNSHLFYKEETHKNIKNREKYAIRNADNIYKNHNLCKLKKYNKNKIKKNDTITKTDKEKILILVDNIYLKYKDIFNEKCYVSLIKIYTFLRSSEYAIKIYTEVFQTHKFKLERHLINIIHSQIVQNTDLIHTISLFQITNNYKNIFLTETSLIAFIDKLNTLILKQTKIEKNELVMALNIIFEFIFNNLLYISNETSNKILQLSNNIEIIDCNINTNKQIMSVINKEYINFNYNSFDLLLKISKNTGHYKKSDFEKYKLWLNNECNKKVDIFVDVANVAYNKNKLSYTVADSLYELLKKSGKTFVFILHERWYKEKYFKKWKKNLYIVPKNNYDDIYWLYGSIFKKSMVITNDQFRDHNNLLNSFEFLQWRMNHQITYTFKNKKIKLLYPNKLDIQIINNNIFFAAPIINENKWIYINKLFV